MVHHTYTHKYTRFIDRTSIKLIKANIVTTSRHRGAIVIALVDECRMGNVSKCDAVSDNGKTKV